MESTPLLDSQIPVSCRRKIVTIEPVQFLFSLYAKGSIPLFNQFLQSRLKRQYSMSASGVTYNDSASGQIEAEASTWLIYMDVAGMIPSFFVVILLGGYSDHKGRKVALLPPLIGAAARLLLAIAIISFDLHLGYLIIASVCEGFGGGICTLMMATFSYISSITDVQSRSRRVVIVEAVNGLAFIVSDFCMGYAISLLGYAWTFVILLGIMFATLCYVAFVLPEVDPVSTTTTATAEFFSLKHFRRLLALYMKDDDSRSGRHWKLRLTLLVLVVTTAVQLGRLDVQTLFMMSAPLCFTSLWIGYFYAASDLVGYLTSLIVTHALVNYVGDQILIAVGLLSGVGYELMFGLSHNRTMLFMASVVGCASLLPVPLIRAYNSKIVRPDEIGLMLASVAWMEMAGALLGEVTQNAVFTATVGWRKNFVFMLDAVFYLLIALLYMCFIGCLRYRKLRATAVTEIPDVNIQSSAVNSNTA